MLSFYPVYANEVDPTRNQSIDIEELIEQPEIKTLTNQQRWFKESFLAQLEATNAVLHTYVIHYLTSEDMDFDENIKKNSK